MRSSRFAIRNLLLCVIVAIVGVFLIAPSLIVVVISFSSGFLMTFPPPGFGVEWYKNFFASETWTSSTLNSLQIASLSTALATFLGTLGAFGLVRGKPHGSRVFVAVILSPLIVPLVITALGMFISYQRLGIGAFSGLVAAHTVLGMPYVLITVLAALHALDPDLELAAQNLGASPARSFCRITLPLIMPGVLIGAIFAFVASWDEVVIALFLTGPAMRTLPVTMWDEARQSVDPTIAAASSMLTGLTFILLMLVLGVRRIASQRTISLNS